MKAKSWYNLFVVVVLILLGIWVWQRVRGPKTNLTSEELVLNDQVNQFLDQAGFEIPDDVERANLADVSGGNATGVATRKTDNGTSQFTVLAALPDLDSGWYQAWLNNSDGSAPVSLGKLRVAKGGYLVETTTNQDWSDKSQVTVTLEQTMDDQPESTILKGSF